MLIMLLGGISEAAELARQLTPFYTVTYSVAGRGRVPELPCAVRVGGFGGVAKMAETLKAGAFDLLIDATHPYAAQISQNAALAAAEAGIPLWAYRRPAWQPQAGDDWRSVADWAGAEQALQGYRRPFFTIGLEPLCHTQRIPENQHWLVRCLATEIPPTPRLTVLHAVGPFTLHDELALFQAYAVDLLIAKNSGGSAVEAKLAAARQIGLPIVLLERPRLPVAAREFSSIDALSAHLAALQGVIKP